MEEPLLILTSSEEGGTGVRGSLKGEAAAGIEGREEEEGGEGGPEEEEDVIPISER